MTAFSYPGLLNAAPRMHLIGCGGSGMRAVAEFGADEGWRMTGSDLAASPRAVAGLQRCGIDVRTGHAADHLPRNAEAVIFSPAVPPENAERLAAQQRGLPEASYPEVLGLLSRSAPTIAVSGTHGKSTTTALIAAALAATGRLRAALCGAESLQRRRHGWSGGGDWCVAEACEYRRHFLTLTPQVGIVLGIEGDHFDCFPTLNDSISAYAEFARRISSDGLLLIRSDVGSTPQVVESLDCRVETLAQEGEPADWTCGSVVADSAGIELDVHFRGRTEARLRLPMVGRHHAINALAAFAALRAVGISAAEIAAALGAFGGLHRRLERLPDWRGLIRYDDYAHHPTAVRAVLAALRAAWPERRIWCVFQPHQLSRTERLCGEFAAALSGADEALILPVYAAREEGAARLTEASQRLAEAAAASGRAQCCTSLDRVVATVETAVRAGDLLVTLGAGDIDRLHYELVRSFS